MKKILIIPLLLLSCAFVRAQDMRSLFMSAPESVLPLLTENSRADCIDYIDAGMEAVVTNSLDGKTVVKALTDDYADIGMTGSSSLQMKLLPLQDGGRIICVVKSVKAEAENSHVAFYDLDWKPVVGKKLLEMPAVVDFFVSADSAAKYIDKCDIYLVKCSLSDGDLTLTAEYTMPSYMNIEDAVLVSPQLRKVIFLWDGRRFVRM